MKLLIIATFITIATAARLEHLQNTYLPPVPAYGSQNPIPFPTGPNQFNGNIHENSRPLAGIRPVNGLSNTNSRPFETIGINQQNGQFYPNSRPSGPIGVNRPNYAAFPSTSNQYLPPNVGSSASANEPLCCAGSINGFGAPAYEVQPVNGLNTLGQRYQSQSFNNQYLAPKVEPVQNYPQQKFDEQTGYHY